MKLNNFRINIIARVLFVAVSIFLLVFLYQNTELIFTGIILSSFLLVQIVSLINYVEKSNRDVTRFLDSIKHSDFTQSFSSTGLGTSFTELNKVFTEVIHEFQKVRNEKEEHFRYLKTVVQHVEVGLMAYDTKGNIVLINNSIKKIFGVPHFKNINKLKSISVQLVKTLFTIKGGEKALEKVYDQNNILQLVIYASRFKLKNRKITLVSIQNIQNELEEKELEAWQKLIRVLTHEILNSMTPIISLSATAKDLLVESKKESKSIIKSDQINDVQSAIETINKRSSGLLYFVEAFRRLYRLPQPDFKIFAVSDLIERCFKLMEVEFEQKNIQFNYKIIPKNIEITADDDLLEQVFLNLFKNSINALENCNSPEIYIEVGLNRLGEIEIKITDNGIGIKPESIDNIFIPFFTTKKEGSGIGLSLSKQILNLHNGSITVISDPGTKTTFVLTL